jgi:hypothetical protein
MKLLLMNWPNKLESYITLDWKMLVRDKRSNLLGSFVSYKVNEVL